MSEQLWLPGLEAPPVRTDGLFLALYPDRNTAAGIATLAGRLRDESHSKAKPLAANRFHVTLHHLGNFVDGLPQERVDAAMRAAATVRMAPFSVEFDTAMSFASKPRPGPMVLCGGEGVVGLHALHDKLGRALEAVGFEVPAGPAFTPHVTLAYGMPWSAARPVEPISWNVREFVLVHSLLGRTRHVPLAHWPLLEPEEAIAVANSL